jgi:hypothetical protein
MWRKAMMRPPPKPARKRSIKPAVSWAERIGALRSRASALLLIGGIAAAGFFVASLESKAKEVSQREVKLQWVNLPMWLSDPAQAPFLKQRELEAGLSEADSIHDPELCRRVGERLAASPWIAAIRSVQAVSNGELRVEAAFRMPLALIENKGMAYLVDTAGVRLPLQMPADQVNRRDWLVITGATGRVPQVGLPWPGDDVAEGLKLVEYLLREQIAGRLSFRPILRGVDVANVGLRRDRQAGELKIVTSNAQATVHWGLPPDEEFSMERPASSKISVLNELFVSQTLQSSRQEIDIRDKNRVLGRGPR